MNNSLNWRQKVTSDIEKQIVFLYNVEKLSASKISKQINLAIVTVLKYLRNNNIEIRDIKNKKINQETKNEVIRLYIEEKKSAYQIHKITNISYDWINKFFTKNDFLIRKHQFLSENQIQEIVELYQSEISISKVAKHFNSNKDIISKILKDNNIEIRKLGSDTKKFKKDDELKIIQLYVKEEKSAEYISKIMNSSEFPILRILREYKIEIKPFQYYYTIKFSEEQKNEIVSLYNDDIISVLKIAEKFKVSSRVIDRIFKEKNVKIKSLAQIKTKLSDEEFEDYLNTVTEYQKYRAEVNKITYKQNLKTLRNYEKRGNFLMHLDHMYSAKHGFLNNISTEIIGHISNLRMIPWKENLSKNCKSYITLEELEHRIKNNIID